MNFKTAALILSFFIFAGKANGQACTALGQNPSTAFPVCGTTTFVQNTVPLCGDRSVPGVGCSNVLTDKNPYWYKFTCFEDGKLAFQITPNDLSSDYDWQLYDITGKNPNEVYTNASIIVASNWSGETGITGASGAGQSVNVCEGMGRPLFSAMPTLIKGHEYIMLVSHFTNSQSGYKLTFGGTGSTASITDPKPPQIEKVIPSCDGSNLTVILNKQMRCASLAADGTDFNLSASGFASVQSAVAVSCTGGFDMDTINISLSGPLPSGTYQLSSATGSDGNSILDYCGVGIPAGGISFTVATVQPTLLDSIIPPTCAPGELTLVFATNIRCNTIADNGSDFVINGPVPVRVTGATANCDAQGLADRITLELSAPIQTGGTYQVSLVNGSDFNTIINECGIPSPAGAAIDFRLSDTVSADFTYNVILGCKTDTIEFQHHGRNNITAYAWNMDDNKRSISQNPVAYYSVFGEKQISLTVSNGFCSDTSSVMIMLDNAINAEFTYPSIICPEEPALFEDQSSGRLNSWNWQFGNGFTSSRQVPGPQPYTIPPLTRELNYNVRLIVGNEIGCFDTASVMVKAVSSCYIAVPSAFTPNNDGRNDYLYPLNAFKATDLQFRVFNRYGQIVFETTDPGKKWDGTIRGVAQPAGNYVWTLSYTESDTGKRVSEKGNSMLIR